MDINMGDSSISNAALPIKASPGIKEPIHRYLNNYRHTIRTTIKSLNNEINALAKLPLTLAIDAKLTNLEAYRRLDNDMAAEQGKLRHTPQLAKDDAYCRASCISLDHVGANIEIRNAGNQIKVRDQTGTKCRMVI